MNSLDYVKRLAERLESVGCVEDSLVLTEVIDEIVEDLETVKRERDVWERRAKTLRNGVFELSGLAWDAWDDVPCNKTEDQTKKRGFDDE
jgi:hypothetical protein